MFERIDISESIYEGGVEPSYKKLFREDANLSGHSRQREENFPHHGLSPRMSRVLGGAENYM